MDLNALIVGGLSGAFFGALFTALFSHLNEKWRVRQGYKEKVYERIVEAILTVHQAFSDLATKKLNFMGLEILDMKIEKKKSKTPLQATP